MYDAEESLLLVKTTINDQEYLYVVDEPKYVKLLKIDEDRVIVHKILYVDHNFAISMDIQMLK